MMKLLISLLIWQRIQGYAVAAAPNEVTGFGTIQQKDKDFIVNEVFVPRQTSNMAFCETAEGAINDIIFDEIEDNPARAGDLRFRWHSHVDGGVYWSPTDEADIAAWEGPWVINLVTNVFGEYKARLDVLAKEIKLQEIELEIQIQLPQPIVPPEIQEACTAEVKEKVKFSPPRIFSQQLGQYQAIAAGNPLLTKEGDMNGTKA